MDLQYSLVHATFCKRHTISECILQATALVCQWWTCTWPALKAPFAWNLCIQTEPHDVHLVPETEWFTLVRVGTASQGPAKLPSYGMLGCTLCSGTCACQMLFSLSYPNLLINLYSEHHKICPRQKTRSGYNSFTVLVALAHCISCVNDKKIRNAVSRVLGALFLAFGCLSWRQSWKTNVWVNECTLSDNYLFCQWSLYSLFLTGTYLKSNYIFNQIGSSLNIFYNT